MIQGLLESAGIPSVLQQVGIDGPASGLRGAESSRGLAAGCWFARARPRRRGLC